MTTHKLAWTLLLTRREIAALMSPRDYLDAVDAGFTALGEGRAHSPAPLHVKVERGGFNAKAAAHEAARCFVALKFNANMPGNPARLGLPTIQGAILLCDADDGRLLAVMDSIEVTLRRTAAATALAARYLARPESSVLAVCGCGAQAAPQIEALRQILPLQRILLWDIDPEKSTRLREHLSRSPTCERPKAGRSRPSPVGIEQSGKATFAQEVEIAPSLASATRRSDAIVTCTTSGEAFLTPADLKPGSFIAAVGADSPNKSEIAPALMAASKVVVDSLEQCAEMGDLHHAVAAGAMRVGQVHAELSELVRGVKAGRSDAHETCIFDSTGVAVQDVASAVRVFERACALGIGTRIDFGSV
jgi:ornithine cyclodeaminase/alanine dehydrogenase-like protein (mu-crystallin family)